MAKNKSKGVRTTAQGRAPRLRGPPPSAEEQWATENFSYMHRLPGGLTYENERLLRQHEQAAAGDWGQPMVQRSAAAAIEAIDSILKQPGIREAIVDKLKRARTLFRETTQMKPYRSPRGKAWSLDEEIATKRAAIYNRHNEAANLLQSIPRGFEIPGYRR